MSKLLPFPGRRHVKETAASWIVRLDEGLTPVERAELAQWIEADPSHGRALVSVARTWDAFDTLGELAQMFPLERYGHERRPARWPRVAAIVGAAGAAAIGAYSYVDGIRQSRPAAEAAAATVLSPTAMDRDVVDISSTYETAVGEQLSVRLADASVMTLNTDTLLVVEYSRDQRLVSMRRGEAIFRVEHDPVRPFRVRAGDRVVQAIGTVFNVRLRSEDDFEVTVTEGRVAVAHPASGSVTGTAVAARPELTLVAGNLALIRARGEEVRSIEPAQIEASLAWQRGMLIYRGETLADVLADMGRYTNVRFAIADDSLRDRRVGGYFRAGDVDGLLLALHESFGVEQRRDGDTIILTAGR
jgi:transmembrane sensor